MGINISVKRVTGKTTEETWCGNPFTHYETEKQDWFDHLRHSGDADFVLENEFVFFDGEERQFARPKDFNECRKWVKEKVYIGNQQRLLNALDKIEQDETLCFTWSW